MELITKYNRAAPSWGSKMQKLGYVDAYSKFLNSQTLAHGPVLDAGTGTGAFAQAWVAQGGSTELSLLDPSRKMLDAAEANLKRQNAYPNIIKSRIEDHKSPSPYSAVLAAHVIDHCDKPAAAFGNFYRWLEPRGKLYLVISRPHWCNWFIWLRYRHRWFSAADVVHMAHQAGFQHHQTHRFVSGPPSRTSLGYVFIKS